MTEERKQKIVAAVKAITDELNGGNRVHVAEVIVDTIRREHRTLQQSFWSSILLAQIDYAEVPYDLRNQAAVGFAKEVRELAKEKNVDGGFVYV